MLNVHTYLGRDKATTAIQMALEGDTFFFDLANPCKGKHLETATIGQNRLWPRHEGMQSASFFDQIFARTKMQMIGIAEHDFGANFKHFTRCHRLDGG